MTKGNLVGKIFGIALVFVMVGSMLGGISSAAPASSNDPTSLFAGTESSSIAGSNDYGLELNQTQNTTHRSSFSPCSSTPSENSMDSNWSEKPVIVNIQVNLESEEDQRYIHEILSEIESHGWITIVFVTGEFASEHPEVVSEIEKKGHYIGVYG